MPFTTSSHADSRADSPLRADRGRASPAQRTKELQRVIEIWVGNKRLAETMSRQELGALEGFERVMVIRNTLLAGSIAYTHHEKRNDCTLAVYELVGNLCDNNGGRCTLSIGRMAQMIGRESQTISAALARLVEAGLLVPERRNGKSTWYSLQVPREMPNMRPSMGAFVEALSLRAAPVGRPRLQPDGEKTPLRQWEGVSQNPPPSTA